MFLKIPQNSQKRKTPVPEYLFLKRYRPQTYKFIKKRLWHRCFPMNFAKFLRAPIFTEHLRWLLLKQLLATDSFTFGSSNSMTIPVANTHLNFKIY